MTSYLEGLVRRFGPKGALVDSNLLLLILVGFYDPAVISDTRFKRLAKYTLKDFEFLVLFLRHFKMVVTTPHVLTEVSKSGGTVT